MMYGYAQMNLGQHEHTVEVTLNLRSATIYVLDDVNYQKYNAFQRFDYYGGPCTTPSVRIRLPYGGRWHLVVEHDQNLPPGAQVATFRTTP